MRPLLRRQGKGDPAPRTAMRRLRRAVQRRATVPAVPRRPRVGPGAPAPGGCAGQQAHPRRVPARKRDATAFPPRRAARHGWNRDLGWVSSVHDDEPAAPGGRQRPPRRPGLPRRRLPQAGQGALCRQFRRLHADLQLGRAGVPPVAKGAPPQGAVEPSFPAPELPLHRRRAAGGPRSCPLRRGGQRRSPLPRRLVYGRLPTTPLSESTSPARPRSSTGSRRRSSRSR